MPYLFIDTGFISTNRIGAESEGLSYANDERKDFTVALKNYQTITLNFDIIQSIKYS